MHIYPIRQTRNYWKIPLYSCHECTHTCRHKLVVNPYGQIDVIPNPEYNPITRTCEQYENICIATVPLHSFDFQSPRSIEGHVYYPDLVVIPDLQFSLFLNFPFTTAVEVNIEVQDKITLREVLETIKQIYKQIYEDEEKTADPIIHEYTVPCTCISSNFREAMQRYAYTLPASSDVTCSVCLIEIDGESETARLSCNHYYHKECIIAWCEKGSGHRCPMCRCPILSCDVCANTRQVYRREEFVVIPLHLRQGNVERNTTNGLYGIYDHDIENLYITDLHYNRITKTLHVSINV